MKILLAIGFFGILMVYTPRQQKKYSAIESNLTGIAMGQTQDHPGKQLMEMNCYMCHNPKTSKESMIAPPMVSIKMQYLSEVVSKEDFVNDFVSFVKNPSEEKSKMPEAITNFGLMPYQFYPENTIRQIADYLYEYDVEEPKWFPKN